VPSIDPAAGSPVHLIGVQAPAAISASAGVAASYRASRPANALARRVP